MACVTLKRSLEFDPLYPQPGGSSSCSPRPHKRRRCMPMCIPASQLTSSHVTTSAMPGFSGATSLTASSFATTPNSCYKNTATGVSHFASATPTIQQGEIAQRVREEIRRLKRRRLLPTSPPSSPSSSSSGGLDSRSTMDVEGGYDSSSSNSPSASPPRTTTPPTTTPAAAAAAAAAGVVRRVTSSKDKPLFTYRQVNHLCEQLVREREDKIREEYDRVLASKLNEQFDCFLKFTADQITQQLSRNNRPTYLS